MRLLPSLSTGIRLEKRISLAVFLIATIPWLLFLLLGSWIYPHPSEKPMTLPVLISVTTALGLAILLNRMVLSFRRQVKSKIRESPFSDSIAGDAKDESELLDRFLNRIHQVLTDREKEATEVRNRLVALNAVATAVTQTVNVDLLLNEVLGIVLEVTGFDGGTIFLIGPEDESLLLRVWKGLQWDSGLGFEQIKVGQGMVGECARRKEIIFVRNAEEDRQWQLPDLKDKGIGALLVFPLVAKGRVFGAVTLASSKSRQPSLEENEFLEAVGQQLGMAIDNINLLSEWSKKAQDLSVLLDTSTHLSASVNLDQVLGILAQKILSTLNAEICWVALVDREKNRLMFETFSRAQGQTSVIADSSFDHARGSARSHSHVFLRRSGIECDSPGEATSPKAKTVGWEHLPLHQKVIDTGRMMETGKDCQMSSAERELLELRKGSEAILMPLSVGKLVLGIAGVGIAARDKVCPENLNLCRSMISQAAFAVDHARLYADVKQKADEAWSLYQVAQRISSIPNSDELLDQILGVIVDSFGYLSCAIFLPDNNRKELYIKAACGPGDEPTDRTRIKVGEENAPGRAAQKGEPAVAVGISDDERYGLGMKESRSEVAVPIRLKGEMIGVLDAKSEKPFAFGDQDIRMLSQLASQIAVVLENSRLFAEEKRRNVQLALVNDVGRKAVSTLNLDRLLENTAEVIQLSFKYDHVSLFLVDESSGELILKAFCGKSSNIIEPGHGLKKGAGMVGKAVEIGRTILCNDVSTEQCYIPAIADAMSELSVPIKSGRSVVGVLDVENGAKHTFDEQDVAVLETVTDLLSTPIENSRLYEEAKRKAYRLELTDQINRAISSTLDLERVFQVVSLELNKIMEYDEISLNFWCPEEGLFKVEMAFCPKENLKPGIKRSIPADQTTMSDVIQTKKPHCQTKLALTQDSGPSDRLVFSKGMRSYVHVPITNQEKVIAVLSLESRKDHGFKNDQIELLNSIAGHLSVAIQNARLFSDLEDTCRNLKNTQNQMIQVERFRALGEMAGGVVHDFNNVLASVLGRVQLLLLRLRKGKAKPSMDLVRNLQVIENSALEGARMLSRIGEFTKGSAQTDFRPVDLNELVDASLEMTKAHWRDKALLSGTRVEVKKELKAESKISGDDSLLRDVFTNLILNAMDAMPEGGTLTLRTDEDEQFVLVTVEDTGVGMTEEVKSHVFVPFFTTKGEEGTGLGLSLAHGIITQHGGEITAESTPGRGSSFIIRLPKCAPADGERVLPASSQEKARILVIEDETNIREVLDEMLSGAGHEVAQAASGEEGIRIFQTKKADMVITDLGMPGISGWEVAHRIKELDPSTWVILSTGWGAKLDETEVYREKIDRIIRKPFKMQQILDLISELMAQRKTETANT
ncbi:MAG: GAF domain-containing protein [Candidatus Zixiibacteriota bacterium]